MDIKKPDRTALKSYFVKNAVPTAANFADLVDGTINQKEDGIAKLPGEPLSVQADGNDTSQKKTINFYKNFADPKPAWTLSLNPRVDPNDAKTAKPGWSVGDADGNSKLFIDETTGNVGIATTTPAGKVEVNGSVVISNGRSFATQNKYMASGSLTIGGTNVNYGGGNSWNTNTAALLLETSANTEIAVHDSNTRVASLMYYEGEAANRITIGRDMGWGKISQVVFPGAITPSAGNADNVGIMFPRDPFGGGGDAAWIRYYSRGGEACTLEIGVSNDGDDHLALMSSGNVGIGTNSPAAKLDVRGGIFAGNSDIYFTKTDHNHTGIGNVAGLAAIENAVNYNALMILGRAGTANGRRVELWDYLKVNGTFVNNSDLREKHDVADLKYGLKEVLSLRPVSFNWNEIVNPHKTIGLIAQEVQPVLGEAVYKDGTEADAHLSIAYTSLIPVLINAIKELSDKVDELSGNKPTAAQNT